MNVALLLAIGLTTFARAPTCPPTRERSELVSQAEQSLGANLPAFVFCVYGSIDDGVVWLLSIDAYEKPTGRHLEALSYPDEIKEGLGLFSLRELGGAAPAPSFVDFNFDGYLDVSLVAFVGATGNSGSNIWLFDPEEKRFVYEKVLSGRRLEIDSARQELTSGWNGGHAGAIYGKSVFRWLDGRATLVRDESQRWDDERDCYDFRLQEWREGQLVETARECTPVPN